MSYSYTYARRDFAPQYLISDRTYKAYLKEKRAGKRCRRLALFDIVIVFAFICAGMFYFFKSIGVI
ncbi:MAG: hypothetical protein IJ228_11035 [Succinivibrio sp.]|nr:hypothetical protein [Succinivibrio sp.]